MNPKATIKQRLNSGAYWVMDKEGKAVPFRMNWAQAELFDALHNLNLVLKARQLGFSTFICLLLFDACLVWPNIRAGIIAHNKLDAESLFRDKIKFAYDNLPEETRAARPARTEKAGELLFDNNSSIRVATSFRSGTLQYLHVSEYGKICRKYPEKATEIRTGALNAVQAGQLVFIESTAEGRSGHFFDLCQRAQARAQQGKKLTALDWKFNFFPWWKHPEYRIDPDHVIITAGGREYFEELELKHGIALTAEQRAWYVKKLEDQGDEMKREFPSTPDEAFEAAIQGAYYGKQMAQARKEGRITRVPYDPALLVDTWWDLGMSDQTAIWFTQSTRSGEIRVIDYYEASGEGLPHYANVLAGKGYVYGTHHGPHDLAVRELGTGKSRIETAKALGIKFVTVANIPVQDGIEASRSLLARCWFDEERCAPGIRALCEYQKEWSDERGMYLDRPRHDWTSHGADGFRYMAVGHKDLTDKKPEKGRSAGGRAGWMGA